MPVKTNKPHNTGNFQNLEPIAQREPYEDVSGEERELQSHSAVLPTAYALVQREETLHRSPFQLPHDALLVVRACVGCVPMRLKTLHRRSQAHRQKGFGLPDCECPRKDRSWRHQ